MLNKIVVIFIVMALLVSPVSTGHSQTDKKPVVTFGVNLRSTPISMYQNFQPLMDYLTETTPYRFELKLSRNYQAGLRALADGSTQIGILGDVAFIEAWLRHGAIPILRPLNDEGKPFIRSAIIVPMNSSLRTIGELKGKRIAFDNIHSTTGNLFPRYLLNLNGVRHNDPGTFVSLDSQDAVVRAVLRGEFDAGAVNEQVARKYGHAGVRVLAYSKPIPPGPIVARKGTPKELLTAVTDALLKLDPANPAHARIMLSWDESLKHGFTRAQVSDYRRIYRMFKSIPSGCGKGCHT
jgi:phosphonate transport system substrate-binding protein